MRTLCLQEAFDYIGSGRLVYDMSRGEFPKSLEAGEPGPQPLGLNKLRAMLEVTQLGADAPVWMHSDPVWAQKDPAVATMVRTTVMAFVKDTFSQIFMDYVDPNVLCPQKGR